MCRHGCSCSRWCLKVTMISLQAFKESVKKTLPWWWLLVITRNPLKHINLWLVVWKCLEHDFCFINSDWWFGTVWNMTCVFHCFSIWWEYMEISSSQLTNSYVSEGVGEPPTRNDRPSVLSGDVGLPFLTHFGLSLRFYISLPLSPQPAGPAGNSRMWGLRWWWVKWRIL